MAVIIIMFTGCQTESIDGVIALPDGHVAIEDMRIKVACVRVSDEIPEEQLVVLPKGESEIPFSLNLPQKDEKYFFRYILLSKGGEGTKDGFGVTTANQSSNLTIGGLSIANHIYLKEGYLKRDGTTTNFEEKDYFEIDSLDRQRIIIQPEPLIIEETEAVLKKIINDKMNDFEKEKAIFEYVVVNIPITRDITKSYTQGSLIEKDNPLRSALIEKETVWLGQPFLIKWLLLNAGIDSELVEARQDTLNFSYVYNLVNIDNNNYYVDPVTASIQIHDKQLNVGNYSFESDDLAKEYFINRYLNFTDDFISNRKLTLMFESGQLKKATNLADFGLVKSHLEKVGLDRENTKLVKVSINLPEDIVAPEGGLWVFVTLKSGISNNISETDFIMDQWITIPKGESSSEICLPIVETNQPYIITAIEPRTSINGQVEINNLQDLNNNIILKMQL